MIRKFSGLWMENGIELTPNEKEEEHITTTLPGVGQCVKDTEGHFTTLELKDTLFFHEELAERTEKEFTKQLNGYVKKLRLRKDPLFLFVALGNEEISADALGSETLKFLEVTEHLYQSGYPLNGKGRLAALKSNVSGITGIRSFDIIKGVVDRIQPDIVFAVDTLAAKRTKRLQRALQISDLGITPGSGVNNAKTRLNRESLGVPVVAIGVPLVIYVRHILTEFAERANLGSLPKEAEDLVVTPKEIDWSVTAFAKIIAGAINAVVHKNGFPARLF